MKQKFDVNFFLLLAFFTILMLLGRNEYLTIAERFVRLICSSCIGI